MVLVSASVSLLAACSGGTVPGSESACIESWNEVAAGFDLDLQGGGGARIYVSRQGEPDAIKVDGCRLVIRSDARRCYTAGVWETNAGWHAGESPQACYEGLSYPLHVAEDGTITQQHATESTTTSTSEDGREEPPVSSEPEPEGSAGHSGPVLLSDASGVYRQVGDEVTQLIDGLVAEFVPDGRGGVVFQRSKHDGTIWWRRADAEAAVVLVQVEAPIELNLEGATGRGDARRVWYQRHQRGAGPETTESALRSIGLSDRSDRLEVATGGWEEGVDITWVGDRFISGIWSIETSSGLWLYDIEVGRHLLEPEYGRPQVLPEGLEPMPEGSYWSVVAYDGGTMFAVGWIPPEPGGFFEEQGLYTIDLEAQTAQLLASLDVGEANATVVAIRLADGQIILSRAERSADGRPLGALIVDALTGEVTPLHDDPLVLPCDDCVH